MRTFRISETTDGKKLSFTYVGNMLAVTYYVA
jgi:hypothetical protein